MTPNPTISILHLEDSDLDAEFVKNRLERSGLGVAIERVIDRKGFVARLESRRFDLILSDYQVPTFEGLAALNLAHEHQPETPFLFVSGTMGEELAVETLKRGATDYVLKDRLARLPVAIERALAEAQERAERRRAELALRESEAQYRTLAANLPGGAAFVVDRDLRYRLAEGEALASVGLSSRDLEGKTVFEALDAEVAARCAPYYRAALNGEPFRVEMESHGFHFATHGVPLRDATGAIHGVLAVSYDVTDRKKVEQDRERLLKVAEAARAEAEAANRMKDEFLATLSHELRTPLNAILGWARLLRSAQVDAEDLNEGLAAIERNSQMQAQLIEDLLDISRIISGKLTIDVKRVDLVEVIDAALSAVRLAADARGIRLEKSLDSFSGTISGDTSRLQQVVWNLLSNAAKFTPRGGTVTVRLERAGSNAKITVSDTGQGIPPDFLPHVFERFRQIDGSTTRRHGGLGLGLSIVRQLVEMHGGTIRADSAGEGQGSTFTVTLPVEAPPANPHEAALPPPPATDTPEGRLEGSLKGIRVLVVDDEPDARFLVRRVLQGYGAEVALADCAGMAMSLIDDGFRPDVLLSDIGMPEQDGYDLIRLVRKRYDSKELPAAALTAFARSEDRRKALMAGFQTHLAKPVDPAELVAMVASLVGRTSEAAAPERKS